MLKKLSKLCLSEHAENSAVICNICEVLDIRAKFMLTYSVLTYTVSQSSTSSGSLNWLSKANMAVFRCDHSTFSAIKNCGI